MFTQIILKRNTYYDSVTLMSLGSKIKKIENIEEAVIVMATDMNKGILRVVSLSNDETEAASANDLVIAVKAATSEALDNALKAIDDGLNNKSKSSNKNKSQKEYKTVRSVINDFNDINMAVISLPGRYAKNEALSLLNKGINVMLFSDNVSIEDELLLKKTAVSKGLLLMGPDCGTSIINGVGLCFANKIRRGNIGLVGASGTGLQEVTVQIHRMGAGVSQAIGTGGRDLSKDIGGLMMIQGIELLQNDADTDVIVLISKPPAKEVEENIFNILKNTKKPVVVCFIDGEASNLNNSNIHFCNNLLEAAQLSVKLSKGDSYNEKYDASMLPDVEKRISNINVELNKGQNQLVGLYCGGTLCAEALSVLRDKIPDLKSNVAHSDKEHISSDSKIEGNVLIDLGDDYFTNGKPHPMIEPSLRSNYIVEQSKNDKVAVILLDFELGFGSHANPVNENIDAIRQAKKIANKNNRKLYFVAYICGTDLDKQDLENQRRLLEEEDVIVCDSNVEAALVSAAIIR